jgi:hypothetical protein
MSSGPGRPSTAAAPQRQPQTAEQPGIWVARGGGQAGPITADSLKRRILRRELNGRDHVWWQGAAGWIRIADVPELARLLPLSQPTPASADPFAAADDRAPVAPRESTRVFLAKAGLSRGKRWRRHLALGLAMTGGFAGVVALAVVVADGRKRIELAPVIVDSRPELASWDDVDAEPDGTIVTPTYRCLDGHCQADDAPAVLIKRRKPRQPRAVPQQPPPSVRHTVDRGRTDLDARGAADITAFGGFSSRRLDTGDKAQVELRLTIEPPAVDGADRDEEAVFALVKSRMAGLNQCASGAGAVGLPRGRHDIMFTVDASGRTHRVKLGRTLGASSAGRCIKRQVRKWRFAAASGEATVSFPLILAR